MKLLICLLIALTGIFTSLSLDTCTKIIHFWLGINKILGDHIYCHLSTEGTPFLVVFAT